MLIIYKYQIHYKGIGNFMTAKEAYKILNLLPEAQWEEVKKQYRQLILQAHPDSIGQFNQNPGFYSAQEINLAYATLKEKKSRREGASHTSARGTSREKSPVTWDAPTNENAYVEREILHYAEDYEGNVLGTFCIARGKYLWKTEEDFPLFLLSMYKCGTRLLDEIDARLCRAYAPASRQHILAQLTYLLSQQFIDGTSLLGELARECTPDETAQQADSRFFYMAAMLETAYPTIALQADEPLYPVGVRDHKLYLKNRAGQELGYLSFPDDRLYYIVIPLFEQKRVQIKVRASKPKAPTASQKLHLWLKLPNKNPSQSFMPENLNLQIEGLLREYGA